jgi:hypothetical protein
VICDLQFAICDLRFLPAEAGSHRRAPPPTSGGFRLQAEEFTNHESQIANEYVFVPLFAVVIILMMMTFAFRASAVQLALVLCLGCSSLAAPFGPSQTAGEVRLVEQAEFDEMRASGKYVFSEPLGEVSASEACTSGNVDEQCVNAAHARLRAAAAERGANLVLVGEPSTLQSYPPRYAINGVLYIVRPRG